MDHLLIHRQLMPQRQVLQAQRFSDSRDRNSVATKARRAEMAEDIGRDLLHTREIDAVDDAKQRCPRMAIQERKVKDFKRYG
jgi:hypothetical protein